MVNTLATNVAEKIKLSDTTKTPLAKRKSIKFWLLATVSTVLALAGCSYLFVSRRSHR